MSIVKWDPFHDLTSLQERINRLLEEAFPRAGESEDRGAGIWRPLVDILDTETAIVIEVEVPGIDKDDISIDLKENVLTIKGERKQQADRQDENYYQRERRFGWFQRTFTLPGYVQPESIKATFKQGVLKIEIPKPEERKPKQITID